jgi:predicted ester cyclase
MRRHWLLVLVAVSASVVACTDFQPAPPPANLISVAGDEVERNKAVIRRWVDEAHQKRNLAVIDEIYAPDYRGHMSNGESVDREQGRTMELSFQSDFPKHTVRLDDLIGERDRVVARWTLSATHNSGKDVVLRGVTISRFVDGRIVEEWMTLDNLEFMKQLGVQP